MSLKFFQYKSRYKSRITSNVAMFVIKSITRLFAGVFHVIVRLRQRKGGGADDVYIYVLARQNICRKSVT